MLRAHHPEGKGDGRHHAHPEDHETERVVPRPLLAVDRPEREAADRERDDGRAGPVELRRGLLIAALRHVLPGCPRRHRHQRNVEKERGPPRDRVDQETADQRAEDRGRAGGAGPRPERPSLLAARKVSRDQRQRPRHQERPCGSLQDPEQDEQLGRGGEAAQHRRHTESEQSPQERSLAAVVVVHRAGEDQQRAEGQEVGVVDVRLAFENAEDGAWEVSSDSGQCHVDDRRVEEDDPRPKHRRGEDPAGTGHLVGEVNFPKPSPILRAISAGASSASAPFARRTRTPGWSERRRLARAK